MMIAMISIAFVAAALGVWLASRYFAARGRQADATDMNNLLGPPTSERGLDGLQFDAVDAMFVSIRALSDQVARAHQGQQSIDLFHEMMRLEAIMSMSTRLFDQAYVDIAERNLAVIREFLADPGSWDIEYRQGFMEALYRLHADLRAYLAPQLPNNVDNMIGFLRDHVGGELGLDRVPEQDDYYHN